mmetsp:Transcript_21994/g.30913  ORF Transcript_21994/g.30913 Transcript_21994/m.30913 type:complete len:462 (-) Transcript_21994:142-1527(-)
MANKCSLISTETKKLTGRSSSRSNSSISLSIIGGGLKAIGASTLLLFCIHSSSEAFTNYQPLLRHPHSCGRTYLDSSSHHLDQTLFNHVPSSTRLNLFTLGRNNNGNNNNNNNKNRSIGNTGSIFSPFPGGINFDGLSSTTATSSSTTTTNPNQEDPVAVKIERTSPNSRRISGDIIVPRSIDDVWAILTDYDNLSIHVPNLVESRRLNNSKNNSRSPSSNHNNNNPNNGAIQGDGSYKCRLFQKGAQKIIGFEFAASVTMDMTESVLVKSRQETFVANGVSGVKEIVNSINNSRRQTKTTSSSSPKRSSSSLLREDRRIAFKCVDSQFFSEFDGMWSVQNMPSDAGGREKTRVSYVVDVRPRGPVPVIALEWRIREDVPTNLRAVKKASLDLGKEGVLALRARQQGAPTLGLSRRALNARRAAVDREIQNETLSSSSTTTTTGVDWYKDETMAAYLNDLD